MGVSRKKPQRKRKILKIFITLSFSLMVLSPAIYFVGTIQRYASALTNYYVNETYVSTDEFMESDPQRLEYAAANWSELNYLYYMPSNVTGDGWDYYPFCDVVFERNLWSYGIYNDTQFTAAVDLFDTDDPFNQVKYYIETGHAVAYTGETMIGEALKYAFMKREGQITKANLQRERLFKLVKGINLLTQVTPDGSMARFTVPDNPLSRSLFTQHGDFIFNEQYSHSHAVYHRNITGPNGKEYKFWVEGGTSADLHIGVMSGLGFTYLFVNNQTIRDLIQDTVDSILNSFVNKGWKFIDADGKSHSMGAEAINTRPITDTTYAMAFLRVGKTVNPEKWGELYDKYAYDRNFQKKIGRQTQMGVHNLFIWGSGYFNINLMMNLAVTLTFFEEDPHLKSIYQNDFLKVLYNMVKYHRNAWFDCIYAIGMTTFDFSDYNEYIQIPDEIGVSDDILEYIERDVADCLMRLSYTKQTGRKLHNPCGFDSYDTYSYLTPIPNAPYPDLEIFDWQSRVNMNNPIVQLLGELFSPEIANNGDLGIWDNAVPADWRHSATFIWESSCFDTRSVHGSGDQGVPSGDLTLPYWMGRFLNFSTLYLD